MTPFRKRVDVILREQQAVMSHVNDEDVRRLPEGIQAADRIFVLGEGRSGLVLRMLAVRLMHLGKVTFVVGETTTPAIESGDLLIACSGSGETAVTCLLAEKAAAAGAALAAFTADPESRLARAASLVVMVPTQHKLGSTGVETVQYGASLFEQCVLILCEAIVFGLMPDRTDAVVARHANLE
jgi:6-phospho-3-hexuloisomerase